MAGLFDGTPLERPVTCERCGKIRKQCECPRGADGRVMLPQHQPVRIRRERRGGGKMVTIVSGLDPRATKLALLLKELKTRLGAGGTINDGCIELQGDHRDVLVAIFIQRGYPAKSAGG